MPWSPHVVDRSRNFCTELFNALFLPQLQSLNLDFWSCFAQDEQSYVREKKAAKVVGAATLDMVSLINMSIRFLDSFQALCVAANLLIAAVLNMSMFLIFLRHVFFYILP